MIEVEVLATENQLYALRDLIGEAICGAPDDHPPPCRIAWSIGGHGEEDMSEEEQQRIRNELEPIEVLSIEDANIALGITE